MPRSFNVPEFYRSSYITQIKHARRAQDPRRRDLAPSLIDFGPVRFSLARHFGFCFGVENAIEIAYRALEENPDKRVFLLSEMIHNPRVNGDLRSRGIRFLMDTKGKRLIPFSELCPDDIVIVPAFGTTVELQQELAEIGIDPYQHDATCPFVEKVWKRAAELGRMGFTVIVHGKRTHEETRATFSHSYQGGHTIVILDMADAEFLLSYMRGETSLEEFNTRFEDCMSNGFDPTRHLKRVGVVNQTTMLATETQAISDRIRRGMCELYGEENIKEHFADTRDTLCYATNENQTATRQLMESEADVAIVVGGYNSSNTSHLVELCEERVPTYYIKDAEEIVDRGKIRHFNLAKKSVDTSHDWLPEPSGQPLHIALTSGASCPDSTVEEVMLRIVSFFDVASDPKIPVLEAAGF